MEIRCQLGLSLPVGLGTLAVDTDTKASSGTDGPTVGSRVWEKGRNAQAGNFQVSTLSSFHSRKEGRKEGRRPETSGSGGWDGGRIRFGADKIHIKGAAEHCGSTCIHLVRRLIASIQIRNNKCSAGPD